MCCFDKVLHKERLKPGNLDPYLYGDRSFMNKLQAALTKCSMQIICTLACVQCSHVDPDISMDLTILIKIKRMFFKYIEYLKMYFKSPELERILH